MPRPLYQERVLTEQTELTEKLVKLRQFIATEEFASVPTDERNLLLGQSSHMAAYSDILAQRIAKFE